jgi:hypothetical protein
MQFLRTFQVYLHAEFHLPSSNDSLITAIKLIAKYTLLPFTTFLFIILQKIETRKSTFDSNIPQNVSIQRNYGSSVGRSGTSITEFRTIVNLVSWMVEN